MHQNSEILKNLIQHVQLSIKMNIGDGSNTLIWHDPWVSSVLGFCVVQPPHSPHTNWVLNLMDQHSLNQNHQLVHYLFLVAQAHAIFSISMAPIGTPDFLVWLFEQTSQYTIKSNYKYLI